LPASTSGSGQKKPRKLLYRDGFQSCCDGLKKKIARLDEILSGLVHVVQRIPEEFVVSDCTHLGSIKSRSVGDNVAVRVTYRFDDSEVELLHIEETDDSEPFIG
jgi:hypothetical protein